MGSNLQLWQQCKLKDVAYLHKDQVNPVDLGDVIVHHYSIPAFDEGQVPKQESAENIKSNKFLVPPDAVLLSKLNPRFPRVWLPQIDPTIKSLASTEFLILRPQANTDRRFLKFLCSAPVFMAKLLERVTGTSSSHQRVRPDDVLTIEVDIPPPSEQHAIAAILGALDDKIELNCQMNQTLEAMAQALFKSWFVDFEPFNDQDMQESVLGPIPREWRCATVSEAIEINPSRRVEQGANTIYVDMASLPTTSARVLTVIRRAFTGSGSRFRNGDILLGRITPCLENGKTAIVDFLEDGENGWGSTEFIVLGPRLPLSTPFIYCLARNPDFRAHAIQAMTGTSGRQRVDTGCFSYYWLAIPPKSVAEQFDHKVEPWFQMMKANDDESHVLATIRDALLPKLVSGKIRVKDAEKFVENAV